MQGGLEPGKSSPALIKPALYPQVAEGLELKDKSRLRYPINGDWDSPLLPESQLTWVGVGSKGGGRFMDQL